MSPSSHSSEQTQVLFTYTMPTSGSLFRFFLFFFVPAYLRQEFGTLRFAVMLRPHTRICAYVSLYARLFVTKL